MSEKLTKLALPLDDGVTVELTVVRATARIGVERFQLISKMRETFDKSKANETDRIIGISIYPDLISATSEATGFSEWPVPFEEFAELPEDFVNSWADAVYKINPSWQPKPPPDENADPKNAGNSPKTKKR